ncbi:FMRFamide receptor [Episyrphus balteatus]|uniref:FMRFamide receptor n=1 Tax=Episyrphus balteatus TaxID=286459 RepID=UPI0024863193|nr:FMRFamide receptor [Episyrphus balteatus]
MIDFNITSSFYQSAETPFGEPSRLIVEYVDAVTGGETSTTATSAPIFATKFLNLTFSSGLFPSDFGLINFTNLNNSYIENDDDDDWSKCKDEYNPASSLNRLEFWVCGVILNLVGILGILGNILSMVILSRPQMRSSINYLLIGLARCDTVLIITSMLLFGIPSIYPYTGYLFYYYYYIYPNISPCVFPIAMAMQTASVYMTFTVTLERYVAVCHPLKARALCTYGRAKIYFIGCIVFAVFYNLPRFWEVVVLAYTPPGTNDVIYCVRPSKLRQDTDYINVYVHWCYLVVNYFIPFLNLAVLNCLIYRQIKLANRERQRLSRTEKREIGLATMLLCVVVVFFLLNFLALYNNIQEAFYGFIDDNLIKISNLLVTINSSANFIIYVIFGEKFKRIFLLIFFKRRLSRDQPDLIHYESSISNGDGTTRCSGRFSRHGTQRSMTRNGSTLNSVRLTTGASGTVKIKRNRAPSPGPCVYYPARDIQRCAMSTTTTVLTSETSLNCDWDAKNGQMTSAF